MPIKGGKPTPREMEFARRYAATGDRIYAAEKAGYSQPSVGASKALSRPAVQESIIEQQRRRLETEGPVIFVDTLFDVATDKRQPGSARVAAAREIGKASKMYGIDDLLSGKEPHEMTAEELEVARQKLLNELANRAKPAQSAPDVMG